MNEMSATLDWHAHPNTFVRKGVGAVAFAPLPKLDKSPGAGDPGDSKCTADRVASMN